MSTEQHEISPLNCLSTVLAEISLSRRILWFPTWELHQLYLSGCSSVFIALVILFSSLPCLNGAPVGSKTYIIHTVKNATHHDEMARNAWYTELMEGAQDFLADDHPNDGIDTLHHVYYHVLNGFSARLTTEQVAYMKTLPCVPGLYPDRLYKVLTTHTTEFLGLSGEQAHLWPESNYGSDSIIGVIDSGIWPERLSFSDRGLGPIPKKWKGTCQAGTNFTAVNCNRKIIGARYFSKGYDADKSDTKIVDGASKRKRLRHGAQGQDCGLQGYVGRRPWHGIRHYGSVRPSCGVDVILYTAESGDGELFANGIAIAADNAMKKGVFVSAAGGNNGAWPGSIANVAPWITTVAATTQDRESHQNVLLGDGDILIGSLRYSDRAGLHKMSNAPLVYAGDAAINRLAAENASFCQSGTLDASLVAGKIVVCNYDGQIFHEYKPLGMVDAGAVGIIKANTPDVGEGVFANDLPYPNSWVGNEARLSIMAYIRSTAAHTATILPPEKTIFGVTPAPKVTSFSSRGPIHLYGSRQRLKPDIAARGVDILAAGIKD